MSGVVCAAGAYESGVGGHAGRCAGFSLESVVSVRCGALSSALVFLLVRPGEEGLAFHVRFHQLHLWISVDKQ